MQLSNRERTIISRAESSVRRAKVGRIMMLALMLVGLASMLAGMFEPDTVAYFLVLLVLYAILGPQLVGPKYEELVALLVRMCAETESEEVPGVEDQIIDVLSRKACAQSDRDNQISEPRLRIHSQPNSL